MLSELHISNLAVIEDTTLSFTKKETALVGETGAGKSLIVDSLSLLSGEKADFTLVRDPEKKAVISALFLLPASFVKDHMELSEYVSSSNELLLKRTLNPDHTSRYYLNGEVVTLALYREAVKHLIDIHSQGANWELFDEKNHLKYLDRFAQEKEGKLLSSYKEAYSLYSQEKEGLAKLLEEHKDLDTDYLSFQITEIEKARLKPHEIEDLDEEFESLRGYEKLVEKMNTLKEATSLPQGSLEDVLRSLENKLSAFSGTALEEDGAAARKDCEKLVEDLRNISSSFRSQNGDPGRIDAINQRLFDLKGLQRKYGKTTDEILSKYSQYKKELALAEGFEEAKDDANRKIEEARKNALAKGEALSAFRKEAAHSLEKKIGNEMKDLLLPPNGFRVEFSRKDISSDGIDSVRFIVALNAGLDFAPLSKATSGGEGARLMLSLKSVLNSLDPYDLLVLDEVDTGVSGRVASLVARKIRTIAESSQVLVISHLPQVVASATIGVRISKKVVDGKTYTTASQLSDGDFVLSIGFMLSGSSLTEEAKEQAEKLIEEFR